MIAILLGVLVRAFWAPGLVWRSGIGFSAKTLLEIAIVLLGASLSAGTVWALGPILLVRHRHHRGDRDCDELRDLQCARLAAADVRS